MENLLPAFEHKSPGIELNTQLGKFVLTHYDTLVRLFDDTQYNHVEHHPEGADNPLGMRLPTDVIVMLLEKNYPHLAMPYVDENTFNWFVSLESRDVQNLETTE